MTNEIISYVQFFEGLRRDWFRDLHNFGAIGMLRRKQCTTICRISDYSQICTLVSLNSFADQWGDRKHRMQDTGMENTGDGMDSDIFQNCT